MAIMATVTQVAKQKETRKLATQLIPTEKFEVIKTGRIPPYPAEKENVPPDVMGSAVDYYTRYLLTNDFRKSFKYAIRGVDIFVKELKSKGEHDYAEEIWRDAVLVGEKYGKSTTRAFNLAWFDSYYRCGIIRKPYDVEDEDRQNLKYMASSCADFVETLGDVVDVGTELKNDKAMTTISVMSCGVKLEELTCEGIVGDIDILTTKALIDIKTTKGAQKSDVLKREAKMQMALYYLLGLRSEDEQIRQAFERIEKLAFFNPRHGVGYVIDIADIGQKAFDTIALSVLGLEE